MIHILLHLPLLHLPLQIMRQVILLLTSRHEPRRMREHIVHLLQRHLLGLRQQEIEKERIGEIANHEEKVVPVLDIFHGNGRDLADHRVKGKRERRGDGDSLGPSAGVKHLGGDDPRQGSAGGREGKVVEP